MTYEGEGKRHKWRMKKMLLLTAPAGRNNKVRVMDVVWLVKKTQGNAVSGTESVTDEVMR